MLKRLKKINPVIIAFFLTALYFIIFQSLGGWINKMEVSILNTTGHNIKAISYLGIYLLVIISFLVFLFHENKWVSWALLFFSALCLPLNLGYRWANNLGFGYEDALLLMQNVGFNLEGELLSTYGVNVLSAILISILFIAFSLFFRNIFSQLRFKKIVWLIIPVTSFFGMFMIINHSNANRLSFPSYYRIPAVFLYSSLKQIYTGPRDKVEVEPSETKIADHIIWIVDESVRAEYLQINGHPEESTPFLKSIEKEIINFGTAASISVCSDYSHIGLMSGIKPSQLPDLKGLSRKQPSVFQYAKQAGYQTNLLYAPGLKQKPYGYMTNDDFKHIDYKYHTRQFYPNAEAFEVDILSVDEMSNIVNRNKSSFTYFLKYGCHFHYESTYPESERHFNPVQSIESWDRTDREKLLNSYRNAIRWEVDHFFELLYEKLKGKSVLIIYTSDHGQNLMDVPGIQLTHCIKGKAPKEMASVPLFLLPMNEKVKSNLDSLAIFQNRDKGMHFNIFPTTLKSMGYDSSWIAEKYGPNLFDDLGAQERVFISGDLFGRSMLFKNYFDQQ